MHSIAVTTERGVASVMVGTEWMIASRTNGSVTTAAAIATILSTYFFTSPISTSRSCR